MNSTNGPAAPILEVDNLTVGFGGGAGIIRAVEDVTLDVHAGEILRARR